MLCVQPAGGGVGLTISTPARPATSARLLKAVTNRSRIGERLSAGRTTSVEVTRQLLDRIAVVDRAGSVQTRAVLAIAADALEIAASLDRDLAAGRRRSALHGVPVLIKDNIEAIGLPGTAGSLALADRVVTRDAAIVANLRHALFQIGEIDFRLLKRTALDAVRQREFSG